MLRRLDRIADIQAGLDEAKRGEFATDAEVAAVILKYVKKVNTACRPERSEGPRARPKEHLWKQR